MVLPNRWLLSKQTHRWALSEQTHLNVMMYVRFPLPLRNVEDLLAERWIDICPETVRHWWNRFGPMFASG